MSPPYARTIHDRPVGCPRCHAQCAAQGSVATRYPESRIGKKWAKKEGLVKANHRFPVRRVLSATSRLSPLG
jgi:hypothetical protein